MPINKFAVARYRLIHQLLSKQDFVKTAAIVEECRRYLGFQVTRRTIQLDLQHMRDDTFLGIHAPIGYCASRKAYFYEQKDFTSRAFCFSRQEVEFMGEIAARLSCQLDSSERQRLEDILVKMQVVSMAN